MVVRLHLPVVCKVKTTVNSIHFMLKPLHLPAVCKVKTTNEDYFAFLLCCICLLFAR